MDTTTILTHTRSRTSTPTAAHRTRTSTPSGRSATSSSAATWSNTTILGYRLRPSANASYSSPALRRTSSPRLHARSDPDAPQAGGQMRVTVAGNVTNSVFAVVRPSQAQQRTSARPTTSALQPGHDQRAGSRAHRQLDGHARIAERGLLRQQRSRSSQGPVVPPNVPEAPFAGPLTPKSLPGIPNPVRATPSTESAATTGRRSPLEPTGAGHERTGHVPSMTKLEAGRSGAGRSGGRGRLASA